MRAALLYPVVFLLLVSPAIEPGMVRAAEPADTTFFETKIRPVLVEHCYKCHSADAKKVRGGLLVDSRDAIRKGGDSGPGVVPDRPEESLLLDAIRYESYEMPPSGKLPDHVVADFEKWISEGAVDPREATISPAAESVGVDIEAGKKFWCFQPLADTPLPEVNNKSWPDSDVDTYLLSRIEAAGIEPVKDADRATLVRRASLALTGLPPTPDAIQRFVEDVTPTPIAFAQLVDRLLESKHFGERWGRHWLDVVRFAESSGGGRTLLFPEAWRYRDYVIDAFNDDMPYDQFLREQIAGDLLPHDDWRTRSRQLTATAFLLLGPTNYELQDKDILEMDIVDEQIDTIGKAFLGMTIGCARCHDHKFDPIPMTDYYAMAGILKNTRSVIHSNVSAWNTVKLPVEEKLEAQLKEHESAVAKLDKQLKQSKNKLKKLTASDLSTSDLGANEGIVVDDVDATKVGVWIKSTHNKKFIGKHYIHDGGKRDATWYVQFTAKLQPGKYEVRVAHTEGGNRSASVPVSVTHADGKTEKRIDQTKAPKLGAFVSLGTFRFDELATVEVSNDGAADGVVIADAVQFIAEGKESPEAASEEPQNDDSEKVEKHRLEKRRLDELVKNLEKQLKDLKASGPVRPVAMAPVEERKDGRHSSCDSRCRPQQGPEGATRSAAGRICYGLPRDLEAIERSSGACKLGGRPSQSVDCPNDCESRLVLAIRAGPCAHGR